MSTLRPGRLWIAVVAVAAGWLGTARDAHATLGGDAASVAANRQRLGGTLTAEKLAAPAGERHELRLPSGVLVRQYVAPGGAVYAIAWSGPRMPDLRELLGPYFAQLGDARRRGGHHRVTRAGADLVVESSGHRHAFAGRAWVPSLVPAGVDPATAIEARP